MPKHTPGPWEHHGEAPLATRPGVTVSRQDHNWTVYAEQAEPGDKLIAECWGDGAEANAALIAAAPDLADALEAILADLHRPEGWKQARAALSKAGR